MMRPGGNVEDAVPLICVFLPGFERKNDTMNFLQHAAQRRPVLWFVLFALGWSWLWWIPFALILQGQAPSTIALLAIFIGAFGPTIAAILLTWMHDGSDGVRALLRRFGAWRVGAIWYVALLLPLLIWVVSSFAYAVYSGVQPHWAAAWYFFPLVLLGAILGGPLTEETGWRGYLLPRLQTSLPAWVAGCAVGIIWAFWHVPLFWIPSMALHPAETGSVVAMLRYALATIPTAILFTWLFNNTRGSLLLSLLFHASYNASAIFVLTSLWPQADLPLVQQLSWVALGVSWLVMGVISLLYGPANLTRRQRVQNAESRGYQH